jgi:hypothetical protein
MQNGYKWTCIAVASSQLKQICYMNIILICFQWNRLEYDWYMLQEHIIMFSGGNNCFGVSFFKCQII